jgi:sigma-B regulation protein RsbU (phosphoserine phosphatase)
MAVHVADLHVLRDQLVARRERLESAAARTHTANVLQLLDQVDRALERMDSGAFGVCEACLGEVEQERLIADPLTNICLECLKPEQARALEADLQLAARIQRGLLPPEDFAAAGWNVAYHYAPAGLVSGDYLDVVSHGRELFFMLGDVSGKGVAASMLMANLHAMFRALVPTGLPLPELVERANRIFCESTLPTQYATLIAGKARECGEVEICNGGHLAPLHLTRDGARAIDSASLPVGLFHDQQFVSSKIQFSPGDSLVLYTDGFTEASGIDGTEYGAQRLAQLLHRCAAEKSRQLVERCIQDVLAFRASSQIGDDQTVMALQFSPVQH